MGSVRTRVTEAGELVIPADLVTAMGAHPGDATVLLLEGHELRVFTVREGIRRAQEIARRYVPEGSSIVDNFIAERHAEAARE